MPRILRRSAALVLAGALVVGAAFAVSEVLSDDEPTSPDNLGSDFSKYLELEGDQVVVVPDGDYHVGSGTVNAPHEATDGEYGGWLVLVAESKHGAVVDLSDAELHLDDDTSRILLVGFSFVDGRIRNQGSDLRFWHTRHSFPYERWVDAGAENGVHRLPNTMAIAGAERVELHGAEFHDIGNDALNVWNSTDIALHGVSITGISHGSDHSEFHADALQTQGNVERLTVTDSVLERTIVNTETDGDVLDVVFEDTWFRDSRSAGVEFVAKEGDDGSRFEVTGRRKNVRSFGHNNGVDRIDTVDGDRAGPESSNRIRVTDADVTTEAPPDTTTDPASAWRGEHPYDAWRDTFFRESS